MLSPCQPFPPEGWFPGLPASPAAAVHRGDLRDLLRPYHSRSEGGWHGGSLRHSGEPPFTLSCSVPYSCTNVLLGFLSIICALTLRFPLFCAALQDAYHTPSRCHSPTPSCPETLPHHWSTTFPGVLLGSSSRRCGVCAPFHAWLTSSLCVSLNVQSPEKRDLKRSSPPLIYNIFF